MCTVRLTFKQLYEELLIRYKWWSQIFLNRTEYKEASTKASQCYNTSCFITIRNSSSFEEQLRLRTLFPLLLAPQTWTQTNGRGCVCCLFVLPNLFKFALAIHSKRGEPLRMCRNVVCIHGRIQFETIKFWFHPSHTLCKCNLKSSELPTSMTCEDVWGLSNTTLLNSSIPHFHLVPRSKPCDGTRSLFICLC